MGRSVLEVMRGVIMLETWWRGRSVRMMRCRGEVVRRMEDLKRTEASSRRLEQHTTASLTSGEAGGGFMELTSGEAGGGFMEVACRLELVMWKVLATDSSCW